MIAKQKKFRRGGKILYGRKKNKKKKCLRLGNVLKLQETQREKQH